MPDVSRRARTEEDSFVLIACDGVWDVLTSAEGNEAVTGIIGERTSDDPASKTLEVLFDELICEDIDDQSQDAGGSDNMSAILIELRPATA